MSILRDDCKKTEELLRYSKMHRVSKVIILSLCVIFLVSGLIISGFIGFRINKNHQRKGRIEILNMELLIMKGKVHYYGSE